MDNYQESPVNNESIGIDMNLPNDENHLNENSEGTFSLHNPPVIKLIENKAVVYDKHQEWKLRKIKKVPLPQPSIKLNIEILSSKDLPSV